MSGDDRRSTNGFGPDYLARSDMPNLRQMMRSGTYVETYVEGNGYGRPIDASAHGRSLDLTRNFAWEA